MQILWQDLRYGARMLVKNPGFTLIAVITLALGIGANTAIFSVVNGVLLRPLPYEEPGRLMLLTEYGANFGEMSISYPNFSDWRAQNRVFEKIGVYNRDDYNLTGSGEVERLRAAQMSADLFDALRVRAALGRVKMEGLRNNSNRVQGYFPFQQFPSGRMIFTVRTQLAPEHLTASVRRQVQEVDPNQPIFEVRTLEQIRAETVAPERLNLTLLGVFAAVALALALIGIYGVISWSVTQRTHEIGLRMALGARGGDVLRLVVWQGMRLVVVGVALGLAGALALTRLMTALLFEVNPSDPITFASITLLLIGVALLACLAPARRATRVDPMVALRCE